MKTARSNRTHTEYLKREFKFTSAKFCHPESEIKKIVNMKKEES